jgi:6-methylsalicylate decarboxylase
MRIDLHQHIWTESLLDALERRDRLPFVRRVNGLTTVHSAGEQPYVIDTASEAPARRADLVHVDGLDLAVIALSSPIGIEALPRAEADELTEAYLRGVAGLGSEFAAWGPIALDRPDPADVDARLAHGCVGISIPAAALDGADALESIGPVLDRIAARQAPLFVHPGPGPGSRIQTPALNEPLWWRALTDYVTQMQNAWLTFAAIGRRQHPELAVLFAMLAGCAPLQYERLGSRGGPAPELRDPLTFYDTSSYGPDAVATISGLVGPEQLVYGSDRPVVEPRPTGLEPVTMLNGTRVLQRLGVPA